MPEPKANLQATISAERYYGIIRGQIEHEDNLVGQRLSWFVGAQAFLFTAYAITVGNAGRSPEPWVYDRTKLLLFLIPVTSILTCVMIYVTVIAGVIAIRDLRQLNRDFADHSATTGLPPVQGYRRTQVLGQAAPLFIPLIFFVVWVILLAQKPG
jgi:hypothetical protein